jgi:hypothetical protein
LPSLFTRLAVAEEELRAVQDTLAQVLDVLAEMRANQDQMREDLDDRLLAEQSSTNQRRPWSAPHRDAFFFTRALLLVRSRIIGIKNSFAEFNIHESAKGSHEDLVFWKDLARIAITGLFLLSIFVAGMYQLLK